MYRSRISWTKLIAIAASIVALAVMIVLPALGRHHFSAAFRPIEARQSAARHSSIDLNDKRAAGAVARLAQLPSFTGLLSAHYRIVTPIRPIVVGIPVRLSHFLVRLKLGADRTSDPPLLAKI